MSNLLIRTLAALILLSGFLVGCSSSPFLYDVRIRPETISPNADGSEDIAEVKYSLSRQASVSIYVLDSAGVRHAFRVDKRRSKGTRTAYFSGVVDDQLLPDGDYTCVLEATDERGRQMQVERPIKIVNGDSVHLTISNLNIYPQRFTPNRDGITDRVKIGYSLNKEVERITVTIIGADGKRYPVAEDRIREAGAAGSHEHDYDAGIDLGATPPPDGQYTVLVEAEDAVGNRASVQGTLEIAGGGVPRVEIVNRAAEFSPQVVVLGDMLTFTCTVKNVGTVPVRTKGPEAGTAYSTSENYNTLNAVEEPGIFRVGLDYEGNSVGRLYPFRWALGAYSELQQLETDIGPQWYLMPGQTATVVGHLRISDRPTKVEPYYWLGLVHEQVAIIQDRVEPTQISVEY